MKKCFLFLLTTVIIAASINTVGAKTNSNQSLASAIRMYKAKNYSQCYTTLTDIVKKDPSNAVAYYYLAITSEQIGKKDEAIANYQKVIDLSPNGKLNLYATKGKTCLETPDKCNELDANSALDSFVQSRFGTGFSEKARSDYEKQKIDNMMREMNRKDDISPSEFKDYKDFSSEVPTNDEIVQAMRVLQRAGFGNIFSGTDLSMSLMNNENDPYKMMNSLMGNDGNLSPQFIQSLLNSQITTSF